MKRTTIASLSVKSGFFTAVRNNKSLIIIFCLFIIGIFCGSLLIKSADIELTSLISDLIGGYISTRRGSAFFSILISSFAAAVPYFLTVFVFGMSPLGVLVSPVVMFIRGLGTGLICGFLYANHSLRGIAFSAILIIPAQMVSAFGLILASREGFCFSCKIAKALSAKGDPVDLSGDFRLYCFRFLFMIPIIFASALLDAVFSAAFIGFFNFS